MKFEINHDLMESIQFAKLAVNNPPLPIINPTQYIMEDIKNELIQQNESTMLQLNITLEQKKVLEEQLEASQITCNRLKELYEQQQSINECNEKALKKSRIFNYLALGISSTITIVSIVVGVFM